MQSVTKKSGSREQQQQQRATVYHEIPGASAEAGMVPGPDAVEPGAIGAAAVKAAAMHQLDRYADDVEQYVNASNLRVLINRIEFTDGAMWQRKGWNLAEVKGSYERVLHEPWLPGVCKAL